MEIHDEGRNWIFTNNGFGAMSQYSDMYLYKKKYIKDLIVTTHENALTGYRNDIEDFYNLSIEIYNASNPQLSPSTCLLRVHVLSLLNYQIN